MIAGIRMENRDLSAYTMIFKGLRMGVITQGVSRDEGRSKDSQRPERGGGTGKGEREEMSSISIHQLSGFSDSIGVTWLLWTYINPS